MFKIKVSAIASGSAFVLSLLIGLMGRASFPVLIMRSLFFGVLFFALTTLITLLVNRFLPELLEDPDTPPPELIIPGSKINIREESSALPAAMQENIYARPDDSEEDLGNIADAGSTGPAVSGQNSEISPGTNDANSLQDVSAGKSGMDQARQNGYNALGNSFAPDSGGGLDVLPDLESLAGAFLPSSGDRDEAIQDYPGEDAPKKSLSGNKPQKMDGDFHPKELAAGIRTVLNKQEG